MPAQPGGAGSLYPTTDGTGSFDVVVPDGTWSIALECESAQQRSFVNVNNYNFVVTNNTDVNGILLTFPVSTATISGTITDIFGNPVVGVQLDANSGSYYPGCVTSDGAGNYQIKVIDGTWNLTVRAAQLYARGYTSAPTQNVSVSGGNQTLHFVVTPIRPMLSQPRIVSGQFQFNLSGFDVRRYRIESSTNLTTWTILGTNQTTGGTLTFTDPTFSPTSRRMYRATVVQ
jgi:hypothetical protein